jgi:murein DD-endopeptidase MepM/ murein hydrolase activator NlpD
MLLTSRVVVAICALLLSAGAASAHPDSLHDRKESLDSRISNLRDRIEAAKGAEDVLSSQIEDTSSEIDGLEARIDALAGRLETLEAELVEHRARLAELEARYEEQTRHLKRLVRDHALAQAQLEERLVKLYQSDRADAIAILLQAESLGALLDQIDFMNEIGRQDRRIAAELRGLKIDMRVARERTGRLKSEVAVAAAALAEQAAAERAARAALLAEQAALEAAQADRRGLLSDVEVSREEAEENLAALEAASAALTGQIQAAQASTSGSPSVGTGGGSASSAGLIWPVSGTLTSGFGPRGGRMHTGIDIAAPAGTPVRAAAAGRVIIAGWSGGYGNLIVVDHGNGLATAYAHLSAIWAGGGSVAQGQSIGAVGSTGNSTGNHLHFEVRVNGSPVNPLSYL